MSLCKNYYVIAGFDLTGYKTEKFEDWKWSDDGEKYFCYHKHKGKIQLFDVDGELYLGYVIVAGDEYEFKTQMFDVDLVRLVDIDVAKKFVELTNIKVIEKMALERCKYKIIVFEECT